LIQETKRVLQIGLVKKYNKMREREYILLFPSSVLDSRILWQGTGE
jgi:hypothetical protein